MSCNLGWMFITANPEIASYAEVCGVHRIFVDMETLGKHERQKHLSAHKAAHTFEDVAAVADALNKAELLVRVNPMHSGSAGEVDEAIANGAGRLMLPMFRRPEEVGQFLEMVDGRVPVTLLAETAPAVSRLQTYLDYLGSQDEVYFGLNDLSLDMKLDYLFEPLAARIFEWGAGTLLARGTRFGFGGIARLGHGELPAEWVLSEHVRLGSSWVILSRAFHENAKNVEELTDKLNLAEELEKLHQAEETLRKSDDRLLESNRQRLEKKVFEIAKRKWAND
ncbi:HpcH/HpaI aldolase/citrate lyase family protein [Modicisalibacter ilicicola DSM 19980]|uniref:HpcH/HpaI aldolase/citrate lyase family protein n=1 Tax=Modicisalibacter ilicicola DSM 19980 TaxID=1121942 RepID=A0A1M5BZZ9_9GAMM|nr:aldolase/citrate lyase family protein [Halomonas ilicicola]SHF48015.1 HpcH/HpaI aldolase/citrate lyase family protein [Halomonas ilicicola DSM 19980]